MQQRHLNWTKCQGDVWCKLNSVNLHHSHFNHMEGVYIIWHGGPNPAVVYIGKGNIKDRLSAQRNDPTIQVYANNDLYVTWANVSAPDHSGIEAYLASRWNPKVGDKHPTASPIAVNSPW